MASKTVVNPKTVSGREVHWKMQDSETMQAVKRNNDKLAANKLRIQKQREEFERACRENP